MSNALTPLIQKYVPAPILKFLTILTNALLQGRVISGGAYSTGVGPNFGSAGIETPGNLRGVQGFLGVPVEAKVKKIIVKKGAQGLKNAIDTAEERDLIIHEAVSHGMPQGAATAASSFLAIFALYLANVDLDKAIDNPLWFLKGAAIFITVRVLMNWQTPGTAVVEGAVVAKENKE